MSKKSSLHFMCLKVLFVQVDLGVYGGGFYPGLDNTNPSIPAITVYSILSFMDACITSVILSVPVSGIDLR